MIEILKEEMNESLKNQGKDNKKLEDINSSPKEY